MSDSRAIGEDNGDGGADVDRTETLGSGLSFADLGGGRFRVEGPLDFETVAEALEVSKDLFAEYPSIEVDLGGVTRGGSAALALLLEWVNWSKNFVREIRFQNVPEQIRAMAAISEVEGLLRSGARWTGLPDEIEVTE